MKTLMLIMLGVLMVSGAQAEPLRVCATVPDLGDLVRRVGGDEVSVTVFAKGTDDPHFLDAKPGFIRDLSRADLYVEVGLELEVGWAPVLLQNARNARVLPGQPGHLDASRAITPLEVPSGEVNRSMGDVHAAGNPHYLLDPENGLAVARLIRDRLSELRPDAAGGFRRRYDAFEQELRAAKARWGEALSKARAVKVVVDHNLWPYFAKRYGLQVVDRLEPKPGLPPTTRHLAAVVEEMKLNQVRLVLSSPYFDPHHADFVARATGARIVPLAHQVGSRPGTEDYIRMVSYNIEHLVAAL